MEPLRSVLFGALLLVLLTLAPRAWAPGFITFENTTHHFENLGQYWMAHCAADKKCRTEVVSQCQDAVSQADQATDTLKRREADAGKELETRASKGEAVESETAGLQKASAELSAAEVGAEKLQKSCKAMGDHAEAIERLGPLDPESETDRKRAEKPTMALFEEIRRVTERVVALDRQLTAADQELGKIEARR